MRDFGLVLSYTGGDTLQALQNLLGARRVAPLYGSADPEAHYPVSAESRFQADFSYLETYAEDRQALLDQLFIQPARRLTLRKFVLGGSLWYPAEAPRSLGSHPFSFLLVPVDQPQFFDSVVTGDDERILGVYAKYPHPPSRWIWGAFQLSGSVLSELFSLWRQRGCQDQYVGPLVNEFLKRGGQTRGVRAGESYYDVGTLRGYREAMQIAATAAHGDNLTIDQPSGEQTDVSAG